MYTIANYLIDRLKELGVEHVFGVPGDYAFPLIDAIEADPGLAWVGTCNELNAAYAADGYARSRGIGVVSGACGVLDLGAAAGVAGAFDEQVPLVVISGYPPRIAMQQRSLSHHGLRGDFRGYLGLYREMTAALAELDDTSACAEIDRVLVACWTEKSPVYLQLPRDVSLLEAQPPSSPLPLMEARSDRAQLDAVLSDLLGLLDTAQRPVLLMDAAVGRYGLTDLVGQVAVRTGIPFAGTFAAKSAGIDETHPMFVGTYLGALGDGVANEAVDSADVLVRLGIHATETNTRRASFGLRGADLVDLQILGATHDESSYPQVAMRDVLQQLAVRVRRRDAAPRPARTVATPFQPRPSTPITQDRLWQAFAAFVEPDDVLVVDQGTGSTSIQTHLDVRTRCITQYSWAAIGYSLPALMGSCLADSEHRHINIVGDGGFQETAQELSTILRHGLAPIILVLNNGHYVIENIVHPDGPVDKAYNALNSWRYHDLPGVLGGHRRPLGLRVTTEDELSAGLAQASGAQRDGRVVLFEVVVAADDLPHQITDMLSAFTSVHR